MLPTPPCFPGGRGNLFGFAASNPSAVTCHRIKRSHHGPRPAPQIASVETGDAELVQRGRDEAAIRAIMQSNNRRLYRLARGILRNDSEAEDVVQETYVRAFTHLDSFRGNSSLATWLARIAMNEALGRSRRQRPGVEWTSLPPEVLEAQIIQFPLSSPPEDPEKSMAQREIQHVVEHAIDDLPEAFRIVFITRCDAHRPPSPSRFQIFIRPSWSAQAAAVGSAVTLTLKSRPMVGRATLTIVASIMLRNMAATNTTPTATFWLMPGISSGSRPKFRALYLGGRRCAASPCWGRAPWVRAWPAACCRQPVDVTVWNRSGVGQPLAADGTRWPAWPPRR